MNVESFDAGEPIQLSLLDGTWRLQYTSASDVVILFQSAETLPFFEVVPSYAYAHLYVSWSLCWISAAFVGRLIKYIKSLSAMINPGKV